MRAYLVAPLRASRHRRRDHLRRRRSAPAAPPAEVVRPLSAVIAEPQAAAAARLDPDVERARSAGGPIDRASYDCSCGYRFDAPVSTTVSCPHCGSDQAW